MESMVNIQNARPVNRVNSVNVLLIVNRANQFDMVGSIKVEEKNENEIDINENYRQFWNRQNNSNNKKT